MLRIGGVIIIIALGSFFLFQLSPNPDEVIPVQGYQCPWGSTDCNPCVYDVEESFESTKRRGEVMGFTHGSYSFNLYLLQHWQGVQRMIAGNGQYLVFTRSSSIGGSVNVVKISSRDIRGL
jgi:hypothetical protein